MKRNLFSVIFITASFIWMIFITVYVFHYIKITKEIADIKESEKNLVNLNFYKKNTDALELEFQSISTQTFSTKSTSEFIARLPKLGEYSGISDMKIENASVKNEKNFEVTELNISVNSSFPNIANFIDILERSKLPIRVANLHMAFDGKMLRSEMVIKIYKKVIEE